MQAFVETTVVVIRKKYNGITFPFNFYDHTTRKSLSGKLVPELVRLQDNALQLRRCKHVGCICFRMYIFDIPVHYMYNPCCCRVPVG